MAVTLAHHNPIGFAFFGVIRGHRLSHFHQSKGCKNGLYKYKISFAHLLPQNLC